MEKWYAVMKKDYEFRDYGSEDYEEAVKMLKEQGEGYIAVIENGDYCAEIIYYADIIENWEVWNMEKWYAVMEDNEDTDWGYGSKDYEEAVKMLKEKGWEDGYIAVIENGDYCADIVYYADIIEN